MLERGETSRRVPRRPFRSRRLNESMTFFVLILVKARIGHSTGETGISPFRLINNSLGRLIGIVIPLFYRSPLAVADVALDKLTIGVPSLLLYVYIVGSYSRECRTDMVLVGATPGHKVGRMNGLNPVMRKCDVL